MMGMKMADLKKADLNNSLLAKANHTIAKIFKTKMRE